MDSTLFREVIGHFMTGVTVITATENGKDHGMSVSAVSSLSMEPPMVLVCLNDSSYTGQVVARTRKFCVNILAEEHPDLAFKFARPAEDKFEGVAVHRGTLDVPVLSDALAWIECEVENDVIGGTHHVFLSTVVDAGARDGTPLAYFRGGFGRVEINANAKAYEAVRELVLTRGLPIDEPIDIPALADRLEMSRTHVFQALLTLQGERLVERDESAGFIVTPIDTATAEQAFDARKAIELAAAELAIGRVDTDQLTQLRQRVEKANALISGGRMTDPHAYALANAELHEFIVALAGNEPLLDAYRRLSIPTLMIRLFTHSDESDDLVREEHARIAQAYESGDLEGARQVIAVHSEHAKKLNGAALAAHGGRL